MIPTNNTYKNINTPQTIYTWQRVYDDFNVRTVEPDTSNPTIIISLTALTNFTYRVGQGPSVTQSFVVSGSDLRTDIVITAPSSYEISLSQNSGFTNSITLPRVNKIVTDTTIYVRLKSGLSAGNVTQNVTITSLGVTTKNISCSGFVLYMPFFYNNIITNTKPIASEELINAMDTTIRDEDSNGSIIIPFLSPFGSFSWFAIPTTSIQKRSWYENDFNKENIGGNGNLFGDITTYDITVDGVLVNYSFYITNYQSEIDTITIINTTI